MGNWAPVELMVPVSFVNGLAMLALFAGVLAVRPAVLVAEDAREEVAPAVEEALPKAA